MPGGVVQVLESDRHAVERAAIGSTADFCGSLSRVGTCAIGRHFDVGIEARIQLLDATEIVFGQFGRRHAARLDERGGFGDAEMADVSCLHHNLAELGSCRDSTGQRTLVRVTPVRVFARRCWPSSP